MLDEAQEGRSGGSQAGPGERLVTAGRKPDLATWSGLRALVATEVLRASRPWLSAPGSGPIAGLCRLCRGPAAAGRSLCFQCGLHRECAQASLADLVVPVAFAIKGGPMAARLWQYKSASRPADGRRGQQVSSDAGALLRALLLLFLRDHGPCLWRAAGVGGPDQVAVVPTGRGRRGPHPLRLLVRDDLDMPWAGLRPRLNGPPERPAPERDLDPARYAAVVAAGARVLLLDDTWTTGSSAQSAAMALRHAGASTVITVVLGRHVSRTLAETAGLTPEVMPYRPDRCPVHAAPDPAPLSAADHRLDP